MSKLYQSKYFRIILFVLPLFVLVCVFASKTYGAICADGSEGGAGGEWCNATNMVSDCCSENCITNSDIFPNGTCEYENCGSLGAACCLDEAVSSCQSDYDCRLDNTCGYCRVPGNPCCSNGACGNDLQCNASNTCCTNDGMACTADYECCSGDCDDVGVCGVTVPPPVPPPGDPAGGGGGGGGAEGSTEQYHIIGNDDRYSVQSVMSGIFNIVLPFAIFAGVFLIILNGYKIMTSQGNPDRIKDGKEGLTSAILGLIFVLLSLVILRTILGGFLGVA